MTEKATCTEPGSRLFTCEYDPQHTKTEPIDVDPDAHKLGGWVEEVQATCTDAGTKAHYQCKYCEKYFDNNEQELDNIDIPVTTSRSSTASKYP